MTLSEKNVLRCGVFVLTLMMFYLIFVKPTYAAAPEIIQEEVVHMEQPEYICVFPESAPVQKYKYVIDEHGLVYIKDSNGSIFAREYTGTDTNKMIYVYIASSGELTPMYKSDGKQVIVQLV